MIGKRGLCNHWAFFPFNKQSWNIRLNAHKQDSFSPQTIRKRSITFHSSPTPFIYQFSLNFDQSYLKIRRLQKQFSITIKDCSVTSYEVTRYEVQITCMWQIDCLLNHIIYIKLSTCDRFKKGGKKWTLRSKDSDLLKLKTRY